MMRRAYQQLESGFINLEHLLVEIENYLAAHRSTLKPHSPVVHKQTILEILRRAADDHEFLARLAADTGTTLKDYPLTWQEKAALTSGDIRRIEGWVGRLNRRLATWPWCRLQQERW